MIEDSLLVRDPQLHTGLLVFCSEVAGPGLVGVHVGGILRVGLSVDEGCCAGRKNRRLVGGATGQHWCVYYSGVVRNGS